MYFESWLLGAHTFKIIAFLLNWLFYHYGLSLFIFYNICSYEVYFVQ